MVNEYIRYVDQAIQQTLARDKSVLLLGPRQTGKTTLVKKLVSDLYLNLMKPQLRLKYSKQPELLESEVHALAEHLERMPLVILDEVQKVPELLNVSQELIDDRIAKFIFTGSSARKLRSDGEVNLLPGRVVNLRLDPLTLDEFDKLPQLNELLLYGSLPGIIKEKNKENRELDLASYVTTYLDEEVRAEALVRNLGGFARFLEQSAAESGYPINLSKLSQEIGVGQSTISAYFKILEDCLIAERIAPLTETKTRRKLVKAQKYLFFDLGVRRLSAEEGLRLPDKYMGHLFEQFVGLELLRRIRMLNIKAKLFYWRDASGIEVDWVIKKDERYIPIEVKLTSLPNQADAKHLKLFLSEYKNADKGYIICQAARRAKLSDSIYAIPWQELHMLLDES